MRINLTFSEEAMQKHIDTFGIPMQYIICIEELSELQKELTKALRGKMNKDHIKEEIADCLYTIRSIQRILGISDRDLQEIIDAKTERGLRRCELNDNNAR